MFDDSSYGAKYPLSGHWSDLPVGMEIVCHGCSADDRVVIHIVGLLTGY